MIHFTAAWGTLVPPTLLNYARWMLKAKNPDVDRWSGEYHAWQMPKAIMDNKEDTPILFIKETNPDDYYVFITNQGQDFGLQEALDKFNLRKFIVHETVNFNNPNTSSTENNLKLYVFNFKEWKDE